MTSAVSEERIQMQEGRFNPSPEWQFNASAHINTFSMTFTEMAVVSLFVTALSGLSPRKRKLQYELRFYEKQSRSRTVAMNSMSVQGYLVVCE